MAEWRNQAYAADLRSVGRNTVRVRFPSRPPKSKERKKERKKEEKMSKINVTDWEDDLPVKIHIKGESKGWIEGTVDAEETDENDLYLKTDKANYIWISTASIDAAEY